MCDARSSPSLGSSGGVTTRCALQINLGTFQVARSGAEGRAEPVAFPRGLYALMARIYYKIISLNFTLCRFATCTSPYKLLAKCRSNAGLLLPDNQPPPVRIPASTLDHVWFSTGGFSSHARRRPTRKPTLLIGPFSIRFFKICVMLRCCKFSDRAAIRVRPCLL